MVYFCLKEILTYFSPNFYQPEKLSATRGHCSSIGKAKLLVLVTDCVHKDFLVFFFNSNISSSKEKKSVYSKPSNFSQTSFPPFLCFKIKESNKGTEKSGIQATLSGHIVFWLCFNMQLIYLNSYNSSLL